MKPKYHNPFVSRSSSPALAALPSSVSRPLLALVISLGFGGNPGRDNSYWDTNASSGVRSGNGDWNLLRVDYQRSRIGDLPRWASGDSAYFNGSGISSITVNSAVSAAAVHIGDAPGNGTNTSVFFSGTNTLTDTGYFGVGWEADVQNGTHSYTAYDTFIQTGGTINITASGIIIGRFGTTASYYMSGGSLTTPNAVNSIRLGNASTALPTLATVQGFL